MRLWERLHARPLPPAEWEALVDAHPPSDAQRATGCAWDPTGLRWPAFAAAVTVDGEQLAVAEWEALAAAGYLSEHEVELLLATVAHLSARSVQAGLDWRLVHDPAFRLELEYCGPRGIPHSTFAGWDEHSRNAALSWLDWSRAACPSCGTRPEEWNPELGGDLHAYHAARHTCRGCEVRERGQSDLDKDRSNPRRHVRLGTTIVLLPNAPDEHEQAVIGGGDRVDQDSRAGQVQASGPGAAGGRAGGPAAEADPGDPPDR